MCYVYDMAYLLYTLTLMIGRGVIAIGLIIVAAFICGLAHNGFRINDLFNGSDNWER